MVMKKNLLTFFLHRGKLCANFLSLAVMILAAFFWSIEAQEANAGERYGFSGSAAAGPVENIKCGFPQVLQAHSPENRKMLLRLQENRISAASFEQVYISPLGFFRIYYDTTGYNAIPLYDRDGNGTPDYLEFVAGSFDHAWVVEVDSLGFKAPPDSSGNARTQYPIYCRRLGFYGQTWLDYEIENLPGSNYVTFIEINTRFDNIVTYPGVTDPIVRDSMAIAVTAAHEFNHALQSGYRLWPENDSFFDLWFIESSATYMEEVVAEEVNDYLQYLEAYLSRTRLPLDESTGGYADYGKVVLEIMLGKLYGSDITRKIWAEIKNLRALPALEKVLDESGTDLAREIRRLSLWVHFTGNYAFGNMYFPDAALFPSPDRKTAGSFLDSGGLLITDSLPRLSFQWYFSPVTALRPQQVLLKPGLESPAASLTSIFVNPVDNRHIQFPAAVAFSLPFLPENSIIPFAVINSYRTGMLNFDYDLISRPSVSEGNETIAVYPQPLRLTKSSPYLKFDNLSPNTEIYIFSSNGFLIKTLYTTATSLVWDVRNSEGKQLSSGVYIYRIVSEGEEKTGKFAIVQ